MFGFANALLAALFAAAVFDFAAAVRHVARTGQHGVPQCAAAALHRLWQQEHFLFGQWGATWRARAGRCAFYLALACYEFRVVFCNSMVRERWPFLHDPLGVVLDWVVFLAFGAKILFGTRYTWRTLGVAGCLYFIARWVYFNGQNIWWIGLAVAVLAAKDVPIRAVMRAFLASGLPAMTAVMALHFAGVLAPDALSERSGEFRRMFGYGHPNTLGGLVLGLVLAWVLLRRSRLRLADVALVAGAAVFLAVGPASRSAAICLMLLAVLLAVFLLLRRAGMQRPLPPCLARIGTGAAVAVVPLVAAASYILPLFTVKIGPWANEIGPTWLARLNDLTTARISQAWSAYRMYDIKIAGQQLMEWPVLDNTFVYVLYQFGPVAAVLLAIGVAWALWQLARCGRWPEVCCLAMVVCYAYMENQALHVTSNPAALLLCAAVYALPPHAWADRAAF